MSEASGATPTFVEFLGAMGGMVYINADVIAMISLGTPMKMPGGEFMDEVRVYFKKGQEIERWVDEDQPYAVFYIDDEYSPQWVEHWQRTLGIPKFPKKEE